MFQLRAEHLKAFEEYMQESFVSRAVSYLRKNRQESVAALSDSELSTEIRQDIEAVKKYQFQYEEEFLAWLLLVTDYPPLKQIPEWSREVLSYPSRPGLRKVDLLRLHLQSKES